MVKETTKDRSPRFRRACHCWEVIIFYWITTGKYAQSQSAQAQFAENMSEIGTDAYANNTLILVEEVDHWKGVIQGFALEFVRGGSRSFRRRAVWGIGWRCKHYRDLCILSLRLKTLGCLPGRQIRTDNVKSLLVIFTYVKNSKASRKL